jgi:hypothetical protein
MRGSVLLGAAVVRRPGQKHLSLKDVRLPVRAAASDAFAPIR